MTVAERYVEAARKRYGNQHATTTAALGWLIIALNSLGNKHREQDRYAEAEPIYRRALAMAEKDPGPFHSNVMLSVHNLAEPYRDQGRYADLAQLYVLQERFAEAEPLVKRELALLQKALGPAHPSVALSLQSLAALYRQQARYADAEPLVKRALAIAEKSMPPGHSGVAGIRNDLALIYHHQGRYPDAEPLYKRALADTEKALGPEHPLVGVRLNNLGGLYERMGRHGEAELFFKRALTIRQRTLGAYHPNVVNVQDNLADLHFKKGEWAQAASYWQKSTDALVRRSRLGVNAPGQLLTSSKTDTQRLGYRFELLIKASWRQAEASRWSGWGMDGRMFQTAQWAQSSKAADSLAQMATRHAKGDGELARLVRERQDLTGEWQARDGQLIDALSQSPDRRKAAAEREQRTRIAAIERRLAEIDRALTAKFPEYAALASPEPLSPAEVQAQLRANEALVLLLDTLEWQGAPEETFIWVVTKTDVRWVRSEFATKALTERVAALRCGLDPAAWEGESASRCAGLFKGYRAQDAAAGKPLPFDLARAHDLYRTLFGQVENLIKDKHMLIVASGPLSALPLHVLVTKAVDRSVEHRDVAWLAKRQALTVLPSVASLKALRQHAKASKAENPFIGFGNPLLTGPSGTDKSAWSKQSCPKSPPAGVRVANRSVRQPISSFFRSGLADVQVIRSQEPLPETADELCAVARAAGSSESAVHLGSKATEANVKALSGNGTLGNVRIVHFATHGLLGRASRDLGASDAEPALVLTPPLKATDEDDGLLTASEVTQLKLDADWVVLSACNTASGGGASLDSEPLSGLASAFFYAGARAMLVSHWAVDSQATVSLITSTFDALKSEPKLGRAEALRRSVLALVATGGRNAHPATWAPFVIVGEGAR